MALINVLVEDQETRTPVQDLNYTDFQIFDNGSLVEPAVFVSASTETSRSTTMWLLVSCPELGQIQDRSGFVAGRLSALKQAIANVDGTATIGVAHWCADGGADIDLLPTEDRDAPLAALERSLHQAPAEPSKSFGTRAFQRALDLIVKETQHPNSEALPVIVVLQDGSLDLSRDGADLIAKKLLYRGAILYQVKSPSEGTKEEYSPLQTISHETGGRVYSVVPEDSAQAMSSIMSALHFRYTLGLILHNVDTEWHVIRIQLTKTALQKHNSVRLGYGHGYLAANSFNTVPPYSRSNYRRETDSSLGANLTNVLDSPTLSHDILFDVKGHGFIGSDRLVEFSFQLRSDQLTWDKMQNGDRRSELEIIVAGYSEEAKEVGHEVVRFQIVRDEAHLPITGDGPFSSSETIVLPEKTSRVRLVVCDVATGKVGRQDLILKEILNAPRSRMVIR